MLNFLRKRRLSPGRDHSQAAARDRTAQLPTDSDYDDADRIADLVARGRHREIVGGAWDVIGRLQFDFLRDRGLEPNHRLLDVGCGALRGGVHFIRYLDPGNYWGVDRNESLIEAGWTAELGELRARQPREQLLCLTDFEFDGLGQTFDFAIAQSLFTHLSFNRIRLCLHHLAAVMAPGALFFATFFEATDEVDRPVCHDPGRRISYPDRDPYHYRFADLSYAAGDAWEAQYIGDWGHPRGQRISSFRRLLPAAARPPT